MSKVIVIGGGAAGMMAALKAAKNGHDVTLLEKNEKLGKKLFITGKGRCNVTNASDMETIMSQIVTNPRFLYSAFSDCSNTDVMELIENGGCPLKIERGQRVFPESDKSSDIISCFSRLLKKAGVEILLNEEVTHIITEEGRAVGVSLFDGKKMSADAIVLATGGLSYASTGSTGDGHRMVRELGHTVTPCFPALVPVNTKEDWCRALQGLSLKNVTFTVKDGKKKLYEDFGEMLFTHFGVSGPMILSASASIKQSLIKQPLDMYIDLKPALTQEALDKRILREFEEAKNKQFKNSINKLLPAKMIPVIIELSGIDPDKKVNEISKEERNRLLMLFKKLPVTLNGPRGYNEAIITKGGINVKEINPSTMESKLVNGLYFAGEVLDLDAYTGGFNLQIAWSTGYLAGTSAVV